MKFNLQNLQTPNYKRYNADERSSGKACVKFHLHLISACTVYRQNPDGQFKKVRVGVSILGSAQNTFGIDLYPRPKLQFPENSRIFQIDINSRENMRITNIPFRLAHNSPCI